MRVRDYRAADRDACLRVFDSNVPESFRAWERTGFMDFLDALPGPFLVLEGPSGEVLGCGGVAREEDGAGSLCWGIVHREYQGRGLGRVLLQERVRRMEAEGCPLARLETIPETVGFFQKMGFEVVATEVHGYAPGMDRVVLERTLGGDADRDG